LINHGNQSTKSLTSVHPETTQCHPDLAIQTTVVATDFFTGGLVILSEGDLALNVLASTAIPMIFPAVTVGSR
jgi:predicted acylesterase/phospholipase RssA